jgi:hypothetical protein
MFKFLQWYTNAPKDQASFPHMVVTAFVAMIVIGALIGIFGSVAYFIEHVAIVKWVLIISLTALMALIISWFVGIMFVRPMIEAIFEDMKRKKEEKYGV